MDNTFILRETEFAIDKNMHYEGAMTIGNGYINLRGAFEEGLDSQPQDLEYIRIPANVTLEKSRKTQSKFGTYIPGVTGNNPLLNEVIVNLPHIINFTLVVDGENMDMEKSAISEYDRSLNMSDGSLARRVVWKTKSGCVIEVKFERFASWADKHLLCQEISLTAVQGSPDLEIFAGIDANVRTNGHNHFSMLNTWVNDAGLPTVQLETDRNVTAWFVADVQSIIPSSPVQWSGYVGRKFAFRLQQGAVIKFDKKVYVATNRDNDNVNAPLLLEQLAKTYAHCSYADLKKKHSEVMALDWNAADIIVEGNEEYQRALRFSIYHLLRAQVKGDSRVAICAKGHAGEAYFGRYFWDTEMYLLPFFLYTFPERARDLALYRYNTLDGAKQNAKKYGYHGARYPWESGTEGTEQCPNWQYGDHEIHVTADAVLGMYHYYKATDDEVFANTKLLPVLVETARYWCSRGDRRNGRCELLGVMGPDEYSPFSRNNYYTNYLAKFSLELTVERLRKLKDNDAAYSEITRELALSETELADFELVAAQLPLPYDEPRKLLLQAEDFMDLADIDFDKEWRDKSKPFGNNVSQERCYRSKCLKQADALMVPFLFPQKFSQEEIGNCYDYYEPLTTHDSSLSPSAHAIVAAWLGKSAIAEQFFRRSIFIDTDAQNCGAADGIHIANAGGNWMVLVYGFLGMQTAINSDELSFQPRLPQGISGLELTINWHGTAVKVASDHQSLRLTNTGSQSINVRVNNRKYILKPEVERKFKLV
ncbi:MAG: glycosyl hydrolase family 65 protein [Bacillota bacterium]